MSDPRKGDLLTSFRWAFEGLTCVIRSERNARIHLAVGLVVMCLGMWLRPSLIEWVLLLNAIALVFASEMVNTIVELAVDLVTQERTPQAKRIKDIAAGAVLIAAVAAAIEGSAILGPPLWAKLSVLWR